MSLLCSLFISCNIFYSLYSFDVFLLIPCTLRMLSSSSLVLAWCFSPFLLYSLYILLFRWSVGVCGAPATLATTASEEEDSDNVRISTTQNLNHASSQFWRDGEGGRGGVTTKWRRITSSTLINTENSEYTVVFESHFRRNRLIQSSSMVVERLAWWYQVCLFFIHFLTWAFPNGEQNITWQKEAN